MNTVSTMNGVTTLGDLLNRIVWMQTLQVGILTVMCALTLGNLAMLVVLAARRYK